MFFSTNFHTSRSPNRAKAAEPAPAHVLSRAVRTDSAPSRALRTLGVWSNYMSLADVANDCERALLTAIAAGDVSVEEGSFANRLTAELLDWMFRPSLKQRRSSPRALFNFPTAGPPASRSEFFVTKLTRPVAR
jgi:hypothetical protein